MCICLFVCLVLFFEWMNECDENYLFFNFKLQCIKMHRVVVSTLEVGTKYISYFQICYASNI